MKRDAILSILIGYLATYLPIFEADSSRAVLALAIATLVYIILIAIEKETKK